MTKNFNPFLPHLFRDGQKRIGFYDYAKQVFYIFNIESGAKYRFLALRHAAAFLAGLAAYIFLYRAVWALLLAAGIYAGMEAALWKRLLPSCRKKTGVERESLTPCLLTGEEQEPAGRILYRGILTAVLGALLIANGYDQGLSGRTLQGSWLLGGACLLFAVWQLLRLFRYKGR